MNSVSNTQSDFSPFASALKSPLKFCKNTLGHTFAPFKEKGKLTQLVKRIVCLAIALLALTPSLVLAVLGCALSLASRPSKRAQFPQREPSPSQEFKEKTPLKKGAFPSEDSVQPMSQPTWPKNSSRAEEDMGNKKKNSGPPLLGSSPPMLFVPSILGEEAIKEDPASLESNKEQGEGAVLEGREVSYLCSLPEGGCERDFLLKKIEKAALRLSRQIPLEEDVKGRKLLPLDESIETILATKKTLLIKALGEEKGPYLFEENGCRAAIFEARGNYRKEMQVHSLSSTLELKDKCPCFAIFDGFKGGQVAITLQENFVPYLQEKLRQLEEAQGKKLKEIEASLVENTLTLACVSYNEELRQKGVNGGATMVLGIIVDSVVWCVNIGSSRILSIGDHFVKQLTEDASLDAERFAKSVVKRGGQITCDRSGLWQLGEKVFVARAFGDFSTKGLTARPKITLSSLEQTKALFFGCSGIFESATAQQIGEYIGQRFQEPSHLEPMVREIGRYAAAAGSVGNLCALAVDVTSLAKR